MRETILAYRAPNAMTDLRRALGGAGDIEVEVRAIDPDGTTFTLDGLVRRNGRMTWTVDRPHLSSMSAYDRLKSWFEAPRPSASVFGLDYRIRELTDDSQ